VQVMASPDDSIVFKLWFDLEMLRCVVSIWVGFGNIFTSPGPTYLRYL
jgi:hypothetical protein